ncbi:MAG: HAD family hydrolase [Candidatus Cryptobacteroides sp.]
MIKLAIFDLDGTLLNTIEDLGNACNHALGQCGFPERRMEEYNMFVGRGIMNLFLKALPEGEGTLENALRMKEHFVPWYNAHSCDFTKPYPGIPGLLDRLSSAGVSIAVASNKYQEGTEMLIRHFFGKYRFAAVLGQREGKPIKPDPAIVSEAMACAGVEKDEVVYCGDSDVDMATGLNSGVRTIGVTWGFRTREELQAFGPWLLADSPDEIADAILKG